MTAPGPREPIELDALPELLTPLRRWAADHGDVVRFTTTDGGEGYSITSPELAEHVLRRNARNYVRGHGVDRVRLLVRGGMLVAEGEAWLRHRALARPLFQRDALAGIVDRIRGEAVATAGAWAAASGTAIDVTAGTSAFALRCIVHGLLGVRDAGPLGELANDAARDLGFARRFRALRPIVGAMIDRGEVSGDGTRDELVDHVLTLVLAGHETTASTLVWIWTLLAAHPAVEARLHAELAAGPVGLPFLDRVIAEALRLYPAVWLLTRRALGPDRFGDVEVAAGAQVFVPLYLVLRHPAHWPDPDAFDPDRFLDPAPRHPLAYAPFGVGPRSCVGEHLARLELREHVAAVAARVALRPTAPVELDPQINLRPRGPVTMTVRAR